MSCSEHSSLKTYDNEVKEGVDVKWSHDTRNDRNGNKCNLVATFVTAPIFEISALNLEHNLFRFMA